MLCILTAGGTTKEEIIKNLRQAVIDLESEPANNCLAFPNFEYQLFETTEFKMMAELLNFSSLESGYMRAPKYQERVTRTESTK